MLSRGAWGAEKMSHDKRLRRAAWAGTKWVCTIAAVLMLAVHVSSVWWYGSWQWKVPVPVGESNREVVVHDGMIHWTRQYADWYRIPDFRSSYSARTGKAWHLLRVVPAWERWAKGYWVHIPLLYPVVMLAIPAVFLWRLDRRRRHRPGACARCGYDRHGLEQDSACPECGVAITTEPGGQS